MTKSKSTRVFEVNEDNVQQILFCDESDTEEALALNEKDIRFLTDDMDYLERNKDVDGSVEVKLEPPQSTALPKLLQNAGQPLASKSTSDIEIQYFD